MTSKEKLEMLGQAHVDMEEATRKIAELKKKLDDFANTLAIICNRIREGLSLNLENGKFSFAPKQGGLRVYRDPQEYPTATQIHEVSQQLEEAEKQLEEAKKILNQNV
ncbi:MAG: hypothetical protein OXG03_02775 [Gammaproteobacteria bacterium]|nr:hypothetical protein [Gammaproteobacteria bacterium]